MLCGVADRLESTRQEEVAQCWVHRPTTRQVLLQSTGLLLCCRTQHVTKANVSVSALSAHLGLRLCPSVCSSDGMFCGTSALGAGDVTGIPVASTCTPACLPACLICLHVHLSAGQHPCLHVPRSAGSPACLHACSMLRTLVPSVHVPCLGCIFRYFDVLPLGRAACYLV